MREDQVDVEELNKRTHIRWIRERATDAEIEDLRQHRNEMRMEIGELHRELAAEREGRRLAVDPEADYDDYDGRIELVRELDFALHGEIPAREKAPVVVWGDLLAEVRRLVAERERRERLKRHARTGAKLCDLFYEFDGDPACLWEHVDAFDDELRADGYRPPSVGRGKAACEPPTGEGTREDGE